MLMNKLHPLVLILAAALATPLRAQSTVEMTDAEVRKVDKETARITLKHGEIKDLDMPAMTMVFKASNAAMLEKVKPGDKVRFSAQKSGDSYVLTAIEAAP
jgi:Cu/Ag efflux protein CusF